MTWEPDARLCYFVKASIDGSSGVPLSSILVVSFCFFSFFDRSFRATNFTQGYIGYAKHSLDNSFHIPCLIYYMHLHIYIKSISRDLYRAAVAIMTDVVTKTEDNLVGAASPVSIEDSSSCEYSCCYFYRKQRCLSDPPRVAGKQTIQKWLISIR